MLRFAPPLPYPTQQKYAIVICHQQVNCDCQTRYDTKGEPDFITYHFVCDCFCTVTGVLSFVCNELILLYTKGRL